jgi:hypothetical protein
MSDPYATTDVPVGRSQDQIRQTLAKAGALGVQFDEEWSDDPKCRVRFAWPMDGPANKVVVRLEVTPLPPGDDPSQRAKRRRVYVDVDQRQRQAWRGLAWYLDSTLKAAVFGLIRFEDVFLSFIEDPASGRTIGDVLIPQLEEGRLALPRGEA